MSAETFVDTSVLYYAFTDSGDPRHARARERVGRLWETPGRAAVSVQVLQELHVNLVRKAGMGVADSAARVQTLLAEGKPVFVDYTAAWCVTCQVNKRTTLADAEVLADFARRNVALLRADWTRRDPAITQALAALGRNGVPVYVLLAPGQPPVVLTELLSRQEVHAALAQL